MAGGYPRSQALRQATDAREDKDCCKLARIRDGLSQERWQELSECLDESARANDRRPCFERFFYRIGRLVGWFGFGRPGRSSIYVLVLLVVFGWWSVAGWALAEHGWCR